LTPVLMNGVEVPVGEMIDRLEECVGFLVGTPTLNSNVPHPILHLIANLVVLNMKGKPASVFGSYGWSGEAIKTVQDILTSMRIKVAPEPIKVRMTPNEQELQACVDFGRKFAEIAAG
jgi:flavorubredoxin